MLASGDLECAVDLARHGGEAHSGLWVHDEGEVVARGNLIPGEDPTTPGEDRGVFKPYGLRIGVQCGLERGLGLGHAWGFELDCYDAHSPTFRCQTSGEPLARVFVTSARPSPGENVCSIRLA